MPSSRRLALIPVIILFSASAGAGAQGPTTAPVSLPTAAQVVAAVAAGVSVAEAPPQPPDIENPGWQDGCEALREETTSAVCVHGDENAERLVVLYGDLHAGMWVPSFDAIGKQFHWQIVQLSKQACQVADFPRYSDVARRLYAECDSYRSFATDRIKALHPDVLIMTSAFKGAYQSVDGAGTTDGLDGAWRAGLDEVMKELAPFVGRMVLLGDMAYPNEAGRDCLSAHPHDVPACNTPSSEAVFVEHNTMEREVAEANGATYVDIVPWLCTDSVCPAVVGGLDTHWDTFHVALNYALWLTAALGDATGLLDYAP